jgi:hypothetical protein
MKYILCISCVHLHDFSDGGEALSVQVNIVDKVEEDLVDSGVGAFEWLVTND